MINIDLLRKITTTPGVPGFEDAIRSLIINEIKGLADEVTVDNLGNIIALKKATSPSSDKKVMLAAHMDEIGFIVTHIDDQGFLRFHTLGGFDPKTLVAQRVIVHGKKELFGVMGTKPIHVMSPEERNKPVTITDFYIDLGLPKEEVEKHIEIGTVVTRYSELLEIGECLNCKSLDNRISVYVLIEVLKDLQGADLPYDVYACFTVQEEVGLRGATVAAHQINPDVGIAIDTTIAYDVPNASPQEKITSLGKGAAIKIMDASTISNHRLVKFFKEIADNNQIKWQPEILTAGGTDTAALQRTGKNGSIAGAISIPTRHIHSVIEMVHKNDVTEAIRLLSTAIKQMNTFYDK